MVTHLGWIMVVPIAGCLWLGVFLDKKLGTSPWLLIILLIIGVAASFRNMFVFATTYGGKGGKK